MFLFLWDINFNLGISLETADLTEQRTIIFAALVTFQLLNALSFSLSRSHFSKKTLENKVLIGASILSIFLLLLAIYVPFMQIFIRTYPLSPLHWLMILLLSAPMVLFQELYKKSVFNSESL